MWLVNATAGTDDRGAEAGRIDRVDRWLSERFADDVRYSATRWLRSPAAARHPLCTGVDSGNVNTEAVTVCDGCVTSADCTARSGGTCVSTGGGMCDSPAAFVCRYPGDACDGCAYCTNDRRGAPVCSKGPPAPPPSADSPPPPPRPTPPIRKTGPQPTANDPSKAPKANARGCKADPQHCCMPNGSIVWLNGCCGGALPDYCGNISGYNGDREADGTCRGCTRKCLPASALIATPRGDLEIASLAIGDLVWTTNAAGARIAAPIEALRSLPISIGSSHRIRRGRLRSACEEESEQSCECPHDQGYRARCGLHAGGLRRSQVVVNDTGRCPDRARRAQRAAQRRAYVPRRHRSPVRCLRAR